MLGRESDVDVGPRDGLEQAFQRELAANRDLVRKCAELDEVIGKSQQLIRELLREGDRLRAELMAAKDSARRADKAGKEADRELRRLREQLERATAELDRLSRTSDQPKAPTGGSARTTLRRLRNKFARDYHPDHAHDAQARLLRQEVFKHVWSVFEELDRTM